MDNEEYLYFYQKDMMSLSFLAFEEMRKNDELTDFKFIFGERSFVGHRLVLAAAIPRFRYLFSAEDEIHGFLRDIDEDTFENLINFAYSGKIKITYGNVRSLLSASEFLQLAQVHDACWEFLEKGLDGNNIWWIREFAETHHRPKLVGLSDDYIRQNFDSFSKSPGFLALPFSYLKKVIRRDDVKVSTEENVFEAVIRWVKASLSERGHHLPELLDSVRLCHICPNYLIGRVSKDELVQESTLCKDMVQDAKLYHFVPGRRSQLQNIHRGKRLFYNEKSRTWERSSEVYAICHTYSGLSVKSFDAINTKWTDLSRCDYHDVCHVAVLNELIYIFMETMIATFDVQMLKWQPLNLKNESSYKSGCASHRGQIYFFGGEADANSSNEVHCFCPQQNKWLKKAKMSRSLEFPGVTSLAEYIYITGGEFMGNFYDKTELYNSDTKEFREISPMFYRRSCHGCSSLDDKVYVCGGFNGSVLNSAEFFDTSVGEWIVIPSMKFSYSSLSLIPNKGQLYALGMRAQDCKEVIKLQIYDPKFNQWKYSCLPADEDVYYTCLASIAKGQKKKHLVKVLHPRTPQNDDELWLEIDDVIEVIDDSTVDVGWWEGILKGNVGFFPSSFVDEYHGTACVGANNPIGKAVKRTRRKKRTEFRSSRTQGQTKKQLVKVIQPYIPLNDDELLLEVDDVIEVIDYSTGDAGWWEGILKRNVGLFHSSFVTSVRAKNSTGKSKKRTKITQVQQKKKS